MTTQVRNPGSLRVGDTNAPVEAAEVNGRLALENITVSGGRAAGMVVQAVASRGLVAVGANGFVEEMAPIGLAGVTGQFKKRIQGKAQTTGTAAVTIATILSSDYPANCVVHARLKFLIFQSAGGNHYAGIIERVWSLTKYTANGAPFSFGGDISGNGETVKGLVQAAGALLGTQATPITYVLSTNDALIKVAGETSTTYEWFLDGEATCYAP